MILSFLKDKPPIRTAEGEATTLEASAFSPANPPEQGRTRDGIVLITMIVLVQVRFFLC